MTQPVPALPPRPSAEAEFRDPPRAQRPMLRWWWPGGAVDAEALCEQLRGFAAAGWGGVEIQPCRIGLPADLPAGQAERLHDVHTPAWFATVGCVMAEAQRLGMVVDVTFGSAWPFGGSEAITPERATQELSLAWTTVQGPGRWQGRPRQPERPQRSASWQAAHGGADPAQALPTGWADRLAASSLVAVLALRGSAPSLGPYTGFIPMTLPDAWGHVLGAGGVDAARTLDLTEQLQPDGTLDWQVPEGEWQIVVLRRFVSDQVILEGAGRGPQLVLDHLSREAFDAHARRVGDAALPHWGEHAGSTWRSVFVDSLEIQADLFWSSDFEAEFERRRGYALRPFLPLLLQPGWFNHFQARRGPALFDDAEVGPRVRADYRETVSELMIERHYQALGDWARRHGVLAKIQAHGAPVDWLRAYAAGGLPETEDLTGGAAPHFLRVARSAAHLYGQRLVTGEAFCWLVEGLAVTPQQVRERADAFFAAGIQQLVGHGASARVSGWPAAQHPWYPFEGMEIGTPLDDANPLWALQRPMVDYLARNQTLLQRGQAAVPVAVLAPADLFAFLSGGERLTAPPWHGALQDAGFDWDWLNAHGLLASRVEPGALVTPGGHRYQAVLLPALGDLPVAVAERLAACARAGVQVWAMDALPSRQSGWLGAAEGDARVRTAMADALAAGSRLVTPSGVGRALRRAGLAPVLKLPADHGLQWHVRQDGAQTWAFVHNPHGEPRSLCLGLTGGQGAELWQGWTGWVQRLATERDGTVGLTLPPRSGCWLRLAPDAQLATLAGQPADPATPMTQAIEGPWQVQACGRGLGGRRLEVEARWDALCDLASDPTLGDFAGELHYRVRFELAPEALAAGPLWLDLGRVADAARVQLNDAAPVTAPEGPFVFDLHRALRAGTNTLHITVANRPENARRDPACPGGIPLPGRRLSRLPTGLLGPVRLITATAPATRWQLV